MISKVTTLWVLNIQLPQNNKGTKKKKKNRRRWLIQRKRTANIPKEG